MIGQDFLFNPLFKTVPSLDRSCNDNFFRIQFCIDYFVDGLQEVRERSICAAMQTLHAMHLAELANTQSKTLYYNIDPFTERTPPPTLGRRSRRPSGADAPAIAALAVGSTAPAPAAAAPTPPPVANLFARDVETDLYDVGKLLG